MYGRVLCKLDVIFGPIITCLIKWGDEFLKGESQVRLMLEDRGLNSLNCVGDYIIKGGFMSEILTPMSLNSVHDDKDLILIVLRSLQYSSRSCCPQSGLISNSISFS